MTHADAINWLKKAFTVTGHDGISAFYEVQTPLWQAPYPEVSGYCIPTLIKAGEEDIALRISRWLRYQQMDDGPIPMGYHNSYIPFVFDTGQVLLGWQAAQVLEPDPRTEESIEKAVSWLKRSWETDRWIAKGIQEYSPTINIRSVWPLQKHDPELADTIISHYLERLEPNGFPTKSDEQHPDEPLTHFVVYVARGFWECGVRGIAKKIMLGLANLQTLSFPARVDHNWQPTSDEICNVAVAQAAVLWKKMGWLNAATRAQEYLLHLDAPWGSNPTDGSYFAHSQISWCAKFIADALCDS